MLTVRVGGGQGVNAFQTNPEEHCFIPPQAIKVNTAGGGGQLALSHRISFFLFCLFLKPF